ncbi:hypothetical protein [Bradyrhizobium sp. 141]|uniref:hypothetical protein n=1 Tax=Bradyrhizobium sp. 141 TaxID=2782617 RepID=UPI001FFBAB66|nr:hypothetical protein [Bradyrhizobium sp. 141]MCK1716410.1 hypothetical protein [Bradyrhizobium sp. 141]
MKQSRLRPWKGFWIASAFAKSFGGQVAVLAMTWKHLPFSAPFRFAENMNGNRALATYLALAALLRMRHDCGNSNNQAAIRVRRDKGDRFP